MLVLKASLEMRYSEAYLEPSRTSFMELIAKKKL